MRKKRVEKGVNVAGKYFSQQQTMQNTVLIVGMTTKKEQRKNGVTVLKREQEE